MKTTTTYDLSDMQTAREKALDDTKVYLNASDEWLEQLYSEIRKAYATDVNAERSIIIQLGIIAGIEGLPAQVIIDKALGRW